MALSYSYRPDYFSVPDILCTEERLSCKIETMMPGLGYLDPSSETEDLPIGAKLELPVWMALPMTEMNSRIISIEIPKIYRETYREILQADAGAITLSKWNPFFYELGMQLRKFPNRESEIITPMLLQTFRFRLRLLINWAQNPTPDLMLSLQLPRLERDLYLLGRKHRTILNKWLKKGSKIIETSEMAQNLRKRKRSDFELD